MLLENSIDAVLRILAITVLIDDHIHPEETSEFSKQIKNLNIFTQDNQLCADPIDFDEWFVNYGKDIQQKLHSDEKENYIYEAIKLISNSTLQIMLYSSMSHVCRCDNEVHETEKELLCMTADFWGLA